MEKHYPCKLNNITYFQYKSCTNDSRQFVFDSIYNSLWCIILVMTPVGYGDIFPITPGGRIIIICSGVVGLIIISLFVSAL